MQWRIARVPVPSHSLSEATGPSALSCATDVVTELLLAHWQWVVDAMGHSRLNKLYPAFTQMSLHASTLPSKPDAAVPTSPPGRTKMCDPVPSALQFHKQPTYR